MRSRSKRPPCEPLGQRCQYVDQDDVDAVAAVLLGEPSNQAPALGVFEAGLAQATGARHAVAVVNGTCALHLAYHALGVGPGRNVLTSANSFLAVASAAQMCGGGVEFLDIDPRTGNLDVALLEQRLERGPAPHVVTVSHFAGLPCDMEWVLALKRRHDFLLVEEASQALGARYHVEGQDYRVGEHPEVDATILSFGPASHITTGDGGAVLVHDEAFAARLRRLRSHGQGRDAEADASKEGAPSWFDPVLELGFDHLMTDIQAALGASQLKKLPDFLEARREIARRYLAELQGFGLPPTAGVGEKADREHAWHLFVIRCEPEERDELMLFLRQRGIETGVHYYPLPLEPWFRGRAGEAFFPMAIAHSASALSLPIFPSLSDEDQGRVISALGEFRRERRVA